MLSKGFKVIGFISFILWKVKKMTINIPQQDNQTSHPTSTDDVNSTWKIGHDPQSQISNNK